MGIERQDNPAFRGLLFSIEKPEFQRGMLGRGVSSKNAQRYVASRLESLSGSDQAEIGTFILHGLGQDSWNKDTKHTAALVFSRLNLQGMNPKDLSSLRDGYLLTVRGQNTLPLGKRSTEALLSIETSLISQLAGRPSSEDLIADIRSAWGQVSVGVDVDLLENGERRRRIDPAIVQRREQILELSRQGMRPTQIHAITGIPGYTVHDDLAYLREQGLLERKPRDPAVSQVIYIDSKPVDYYRQIRNAQRKLDDTEVPISDTEAGDLLHDQVVTLLKRGTNHIRDLDYYFDKMLYKHAISIQRHIEVEQRVRAKLLEQPEVVILSAEDEVLGKEGVFRIFQTISELPERQREVVVLRFLNGFGEKETARTLDISQGTVKSHGSRALHTLREKLAAEGFDISGRIRDKGSKAEGL